jgi:hypothetical protein
MRLRNRIASTLFILFILTGAAFAQTGGIVGQISDESGAVITNAQIAATSTLTGISRTASTTSAGVYSLPALPPSTYDVTVTAPGFQSQTKKSVILTVAASLPLNFTLAVAGDTTTVAVEEAAPAAAETDNFQLSTVVDSKQINDLPLILRDPYQLVLLSPGAVSATNNDGGVSVNGQRDRNNNFMLDGTDNNDTSVPGGLGGISSANPDSAQEFRVITNNFDAEFGRNTGAIVDVVTRGGSNQFHGDAYEFGRYNALGARDFFNKTSNGPQDPYVRNDFGASVGGPLWKDHTFFFLNGEAQRFRTTRSYSQITPTAAFKTGVFTFIDPTDGSMTPVDLITNPVTNPNNLSGLGQDPTVNQVFAVMPIGQYDNGDGVSTTYIFPSPDPLNSYEFTGRFDQKLSEKHQLTVRYIYGHSNDGDPFHDEDLPGYGKTAVIATEHNGAVSIASSLTPTITNLFKGGYNLNNAGFYCDHAGLDSLLGTDTFGNGRDVVIPYFFTMGCWDLGDSNGQARLSSTLFLADTLNLTRGAHSFKFGGEYRSVKDTNFDNFYSRDTLSLNNFTTYGQPSYNIANPNSESLTNFEDMVWGAQGAVANAYEYQFFTKSGVRRANDTDRFRQHEWALFAQDTWKITPHLSLIAGLRYAFNGVPYEKDGDFSNFYGNASAALPSVGYFAFTTVGPGTGKQLYSDSWLMFEPRLGFAYDLTGDGKTAIRGGFGIFHDRVFDNLFGNAKANPPFQASFNDYPQTFDPSTPTVTTYPSPGNLTPSPDITNGDYYEAIVIDPNLKMPTSYSWNIGVQREIRSGLTAEINYVGNHGTHGLREIDKAPPQPSIVQAELSAGVPPLALTYTSLYLGGTYTDSNGNTQSFNPAVNNTAFYHDLFQTSMVSSNYNALQATVRGEIHRLTITGSYTLSHSLDNGSDPLVPGAGGTGLPVDSFNLGPEYGNSDFDVRQRGVLAATYALPIGMGAGFLNQGVIGHIFEGIQISGIQQAQGGLPFDLRGTIDSLHTSLTNRPQLIGQAYPSNRGSIVTLGKITGPARAAFGNAPYDTNLAIHRNQYYGASFVNTDAVFQKSQTLHEEIKLVFRAESYNVLNHPNMSAPASDAIDSPYFGISTSQIGQNDGTTGARQIQGALKVIF